MQYEEFRFSNTSNPYNSPSKAADKIRHGFYAKSNDEYQKFLLAQNPAQPPRTSSGAAWHGLARRSFLILRSGKAFGAQCKESFLLSTFLHSDVRCTPSYSGCVKWLRPLKAGNVPSNDEKSPVRYPEQGYRIGQEVDPARPEWGGEGGTPSSCIMF